MKNQHVVIIASLMVVGIYFKFSNDNNEALERQNELVQKLIEAEKQQLLLRSKLETIYRPNEQAQLPEEIDSKKMGATYIRKKDRPKVELVHFDKDFYMCQEETPVGSQRVVAKVVTNGEIHLWVNFRKKIQLQGEADQVWIYEVYKNRNNFYIDYIEENGQTETYIGKILKYDKSGQHPKVIELPKLKLILKEENCDL